MTSGIAAITGHAVRRAVATQLIDAVSFAEGAVDVRASIVTDEHDGDPPQGARWWKLPVDGGHALRRRFPIDPAGGSVSIDTCLRGGSGPYMAVLGQAGRSWSPVHLGEVR